MEITTSVSIDSAHRLMFHKGKCHNLHGHRWKISIFIAKKDEEYLDMVVDFGDIKKYITDKYDHCAIVYEKDALLLEALNLIGTDFVLLPCETTAENMVSYMKQELCKEFQLDADMLILSIEETPGSLARW